MAGDNTHKLFIRRKSHSADAIGQVFNRACDLLKTAEHDGELFAFLRRRIAPPKARHIHHVMLLVHPALTVHFRVHRRMRIIPAHLRKPEADGHRQKHSDKAPKQF